VTRMEKRLSPRGYRALSRCLIDGMDNIYRRGKRRGKKGRGERERERERGCIIEIHNAAAMSRGSEYNAVRGKKDGEAIRVD